MKRIRAIGAVLVAMFALGVVVAANASAEGYPAFLEGLPSQLIPSGGHLPFLSLTQGNFLLQTTSSGLVLCTHVVTTGTLLPAGLTIARVHYLNCGFVSASGTPLSSSECEIASLGAAEEGHWGLILTNLLHDLLVFKGSEAEAKTLSGPVGDYFVPEENSEFVKLDGEGTNCGAGAKGASTVTGGTIGEVNPVEKMELDGSLTFTSAALPSKVFRFENGTKEEIAPKGLKVFGGVTAKLVGTYENLMLENNEEWGVLRN